MVLGWNLGQIRSNVIKNVKKGFFPILHREYFLRQKLVELRRQEIGRPMQNPVYNIVLRLDLSRLNDYKFRHNFQDCLNILCPTIHYFLHCHYYNDIFKTLLDTRKKIAIISVTNLSDEYLVNLLMYGNPSYSFQENK